MHLVYIMLSLSKYHISAQSSFECNTFSISQMLFTGNKQSYTQIMFEMIVSRYNYTEIIYVRQVFVENEDDKVF